MALGTVWTIGHSNRSAGDFLALLQAHGIETVADVRRFPGSRKHPQFGAEALERTLHEHGIGYVWLPGLGGRRRGEPTDAHAGWRNASFRAYAAYMWGEAFADGLHALLHVALGSRTALMCSEALWWRCHRSLIADVLKQQGFEVAHIFSAGAAKPHPWTAPAQVVDGELSYPAPGAA